MFSQACVIQFTLWMSASVHAGIPHPPLKADTPLGADPHGTDTPREQAPPGADTPLGADTPSRCRACWEIRSTRRRYASYWNAILFVFRKTREMVINNVCSIVV